MPAPAPCASAMSQREFFGRASRAETSPAPSTENRSSWWFRHFDAILAEADGSRVVRVAGVGLEILRPPVADSGREPAVYGHGPVQARLLAGGAGHVFSLERL